MTWAAKLLHKAHLMMDNVTNPALQAILDSLNESTTSQPSESTRFHDEAQSAIPGLGFLPDANAPEQSTSPHKSSRLTTRSDPKSRTVTPIPDASNITSWPAALKYVNRYTGSNEGIGKRIRQMVAEQHKRETQWWTGREAIVNKHQSRLGNQQQAADLLRSIGGIPTTLRPINQGTERAELEAYDKKVYGELLKMTISFDGELRSMGIPFYAIKHDLVVLEENVEKTGGTARIDRGELRELQQRILKHLEDLFLDE